MPFVDRVVLTRETEGVPFWNKFLQGYYDTSGISSDAFDRAVRIDVAGEARLTPEMEEKAIRLTTAARPTSWYMGFNWLDPVIGGPAERARKLRQAVSIAVDWEEYLSIFANGRGIVANGPVPPGIFGYREGDPGINPVTHVVRDGQVRRRPIEDAQKLLAEAGYPGGRDAAKGTPLVLYFDTMDTGAEAKPRLDWLRRQFGKLGVQLEIRSTDYNRFQDKMRKGSAQIFEWGWNADYPDPENFLFLLYGPQGRVKHQGENSSNYENAEYDVLMERMRVMDNGPERQAVIDRMVDILRRDAAWSFGYFGKLFRLDHEWVANDVKYRRIDPALRELRRGEWNGPVLWPVALLLAALAVSAIPAVRIWRRRERMVARPAAGD
jgi:ABC-type transport system substrate-binding protein